MFTSSYLNSTFLSGETIFLSIFILSFKLNFTVAPLYYFIWYIFHNTKQFCHCILVLIYKNLLLSVDIFLNNSEITETIEYWLETLPVVLIQHHTAFYIRMHHSLCFLQLVGRRQLWMCIVQLGCYAKLINPIVIQ